ncbi:hypothetical protein GCM10007387_22690 [Pseudoduganella albidiflava]|nr:hypothetical protein GCM10007387_22690 [Pseudoduganella albidiflava]
MSSVVGEQAPLDSQPQSIHRSTNRPPRIERSIKHEQTGQLVEVANAVTVAMRIIDELPLLAETSPSQQDNSLPDGKILRLSRQAGTDPKQTFAARRTGMLA